jgi:hypothetical protein
MAVAMTPYAASNAKQTIRTILAPKYADFDGMVEEADFPRQRCPVQSR